MTQTRCPACSIFYDKKLRGCPECAHTLTVNSALVNSRWSSNLNAQAEHAVKYG